jgi:hypothetical protein
LIIIEHDLLLYEDAQGMVEYISKGCTMLQKRSQSCLPIPSWRI